MNSDLSPNDEDKNENNNLTDETTRDTEATSVAESVVVHDHKSKSVSKKQIFIILAVIAVIGGGLGTAYGLHLFGFGKKASTKPSDTSIAPAPLVSEEFTPIKQADGSTKVGNRTWLATPVKLDLDKYQVFSAEDLYWYAPDSKGKTVVGGPNYEIYKVGTSGNEDIIEAFGLTLDGGHGIFLTSNGSFKLVKKISTYSYNSDGKLAYKLGTKTTEDTSTDFPELHIPEKLTLNGKEFYSSAASNSGRFSTTEGTNKYTSFAATNYGQVYKNIKPDTGTVDFISSDKYQLATYAFTSVTFLPSPDARSVKAGQLKFADGSKNTVDYGNGFHGCSLGGTFHDVVTDKSLQYQEAGTMANGAVLYDLKAGAKRNQLVASLRKAYNDFYSSDSPPKSLTTAQLEAMKPFFMYKTSLDEYAVIYNLDVIPVGGCGKPVIYLYPTQKTNVSVKVDADIRVSEPAYNGGWNVTAFPNGSLINSDGKTYNSLFWEGYGHTYPEVTEGIVVPTNTVATKLTEQMTRLGLNKTEQQDFLDFWLPKMPDTPFVRLTWFGTNQVNALAPLSITPAPDTLIRVFLDYEGLNSAKVMKPQILTSKARKGFTVVEWGGLLHGKLPSK